MRSFSLVIVAAAIVCVTAGCKGRGRKGAAARCSDWCARRDRAAAAVRADLESAGRAATEITRIEVNDDAAIRPAGQRAEALCSDIRANLAHARGITWAIAQEEQSITGRAGIDGFGIAEELASTAEKMNTCAGRSPAQMRMDFVPQVHALSDKRIASPDAAACAATCEQNLAAK